MINTNALSANFKVLSNTCGNELVGSGVCYITGTFTPTTARSNYLKVDFLYHEGTPVSLSTNANANDTPLIGSVTLPLPFNTPINTDQNVIFTFTNKSDSNIATGVHINKQLGNDFQQTEDTCGTQLLPLESCHISGIFNSSTLSPMSISVTLTYNEGSDIRLQSNTNMVNYTRVFIGDLDLNKVFLCKMNIPSSSLDDCTDSGVTGLLNPESVTLNPSGHYIYIMDRFLNKILKCNVDNVTSAVSNCMDSGAQQINGPIFLSFTSNGKKAFITNNNDPSKVTICDDNRATGALVNCKDAGATGLSSSIGISISPRNTYAYITNYHSNITICGIDLIDNNLISCTNSRPSGLLEPMNLLLNSAGTKLFVTDQKQDKVVMCDVDGVTGALSGCPDSGVIGIGYGRGMLDFYDGNHEIFITGGSNGKISSCDVDMNSGVISNCVDSGATVFSSPTSITNTW